MRAPHRMAGSIDHLVAGAVGLCDGGGSRRVQIADRRTIVTPARRARVRAIMRATRSARMIVLCALAACGRPQPAAPIDAPAIPLAEAKAAFADAAALCAADHGALW